MRYLILILLIAGCASPTPESQGDEQAGLGMVTISEDGSLSPEECERRGLEGKVLMLESRYCGHCRETRPDFIAACEDAGIEPMILDVSEDEGAKALRSYGISIRYTPTFVIGCDYYVGAMSMEEYISLLEGIV